MKIKSESVWVDGIRRHLKDLQEDMYEGASGAERKRRYVTAFSPLTPVALDVLQEVNASLLRGTGEVCVHSPRPDGHSGLIGSWQLTWPELAEASNRMDGKPLRPVMISAIFPAGFTHPHLVAGGAVDPRAASIVAWPMQIASADDAEQQRRVLSANAATGRPGRVHQYGW